MSNSPIDSDQQALYECIQRLAARETNPVLEILNDIPTVEEDTKYPTKGLRFAQQGLRAFYHCHDSTQRPPNEHGHFHLYVCADADADTADWAHLVALAMDEFGQPIQWFSVNRWVTGGKWLTTKALMHLASQLRLNIKMSLTEQWLIALLKVCHTQIQQLLIQRDNFLIQLTTTSNLEEIWQDRRYYELSKSPVDLLALFQQTK